ncbi:transcription elongation factor [Grosmannia clavigera kw1407]|uniref:Transcription elongation factor 1 homolog n=1 Tax=Grosmannia clavigera (strain kw1407 / UAMH 11150) TaxID=655863 RepID=F0XM21_GROCL|nr:transcription elongation factor [Grosmannia clavigera kw1407]EFX01428.1 transcription elongation factor [Grosmannia clavigera kw1407]
MGKRKKSSRKPNGPKRSDPLPTAFTCLFCNHEKSVAVKLDKKVGIGYLECKVCGQKFQCDINYLSAPVDVYGEWVDAADSVAKVEGDSRHERLSSGRLSSKPSRGDAYDDDDGGDRRYDGDGVVGDDEYD